MEQNLNHLKSRKSREKNHKFISANKVFDFSNILYNITYILSKKTNCDIIEVPQAIGEKWGRG